MQRIFKNRWIRFWMKFAGTSSSGRLATRLAALFAPPLYGRVYLAGLNPQGYISPKATIYHADLRLGRNLFIDDDVTIFQDKDGGRIELDDGTHLHRGNSIHTGQGGTITIGSETHIQPYCRLTAFKGPISIGKRAEIAPNCAFYSYSHGMVEGQPIRNQPLQTKGGIIIEDDVWLSVGVIVLDGVRIGKGAVVAAGAVVTRDLAANTISSGVPARVIKVRG